MAIFVDLLENNLSLVSSFILHHFDWKLLLLVCSLTIRFSGKEKMACFSNHCFLLLIIILPVARIGRAENGLKTAVFLSPEFQMEAGSVSVQFFHNINFPRGHIAIKSFDAELVDKTGNSIPLHETYLHHWIIMRYYQSKNTSMIIRYNNSVCGDDLPQYFGLGSETRKTSTFVPDPYGIEAGNPSEIPAGYEEGWTLELHAIDTRGAENKIGCTECRCDLYNVSKDGDGNGLGDGYLGGMKCCRNDLKCRMVGAFEDRNVKRSLFMKYTVKYIGWDSSILGVKIYVLDVTAALNNKSGGSNYNCQVEYQVDPCPASMAKQACIHSKKATITLPSGGEVIYGVAHQHSGGLGSTLFRQDGSVICSSIPTYGQGNDSGYIVGMSTCYPQPGSIKISDTESLTLVSNYSNSLCHTGVMGLFYLLVAEPKLNPSFDTQNSDEKTDKKSGKHSYVWIAVGVAASAFLAIIIIIYQMKCRNKEYEAIAE